MTQCKKCGKPIGRYGEVYCSLKCAAIDRGLGKYIRPVIEKICERCGVVFVLRRQGSGICYRCRKKDYCKKYYGLHKKERRIDKEKKKKSDRESYLRHRDKRSKNAHDRYLKNREVLLGKAEKRRRTRGEKPACECASLPEKMFMNMLSVYGLTIDVDYRFRVKIEEKVEIDFLFDGFIVELMGPHHYLSFRGQERLNRTREIDENKKEICNSIGIELLEVPVYSLANKKNKEKTENNLQEALNFVLSRIGR